MLFRTPPPRKRRVESVIELGSPVPDQQLVIYEDPAPDSFQEPSDQMLCTYQCRQMVKAEFLDALGSSEKQLQQYRAKLEAQTEELQKAEAEQMRLRNKLLFSEQEVAATKGREAALQELLTKEAGDFHERYRTLATRCSELDIKLKKELDARRHAEASLASAKEDVKLLEEKLKQLSEGAEREKNRLQRELSHLRSDSGFSVSQRNADLERAHCRANNAEKEAELLKQQIEELRQQLNESLRCRSQVEKQLPSLSVSSRDTSSNESMILVKHLQEELKHYEAEVEAARNLKSFHLNNELLKEQLLDEKNRREKAEEQVLKLEEALRDSVKLEGELMSWKLLLKEIPDISCRDDIPRKFGDMQKEIIDNMLKLGEVNAHLKELEISLEAADMSKQQSETELALTKEKTDRLTLEIKRLDLLLSSVTKERDRLRNDPTTWRMQKGSSEETQELETTIAERESTIRELDQNLQDQRDVITAQHQEIKLLNEQLNLEARKIKSLEREGDRFRAEISLLESKLGHGDFSSENTKILRMANPLVFDDEAKYTIEALQSELQKAQTKIRALEDLQGHSDGSLIDSDFIEKLAQLRGQIATLEKREERYKTVFADKISVFRRACCSIFGYKIMMDDRQHSNGMPVTRFTLQSIYAVSDDEKLEFEYESGNMKILTNEYISLPEINHQVEIFIRKMDSIPAFAANLTVESFNKRTLS